MDGFARNIGPYRVLGLLGQGGMGVVYRAEHEETGEAVALKTVRVPSEGLLSSIRREIHALSRVRHPGIVRILQTGLHEGLPWYSMELLDGLTLGRYWQGVAGSWPGAQAELEGGRRIPSKASTRAVRQTRSTAWWPESLAGDSGRAPGGKPEPPFAALPAGDADARPAAAAGRLDLAVGLVQRLCAPLEYLHGEGLVHRDLKPANILLRAASGERRAASEQPAAEPGLAARSSQLAAFPVLVDFGLMAHSGAGASREVLDVDALSAGTVSYMAPEQIRGEFVDARADLYALGCLLFELTTGRPPFVGASPREVQRQHLEAPPPLPSALVAGVPAALDELILRLLRKRPRERLGYASDVAAALARLGLAEPPAEALPRPRAYLYRPGFGSRQHEMSLLREQLVRAQAGLGGVVLVGGESGIGKTRLAMELARDAVVSGAQVLVGESLPAGSAGAGGALQPLRRSLQAIADRCRELGPAESGRLVGARAPVLALYESSLALLPGQVPHAMPEELPADAARLRLHTYLTQTFAELASGRPLLLVLDDLQWADELTLSWCGHVLHSGSFARSGVLLLGTYRSDEVHDGLGRLLEAPAALKLGLGRIPEASVASMIGDMLALEAPPQRFGRFLAEQSEGNPFFVAEVLRTAVAERLLWRDGQGRWQVRGAAEDAAGQAELERLPLPSSLRELVCRRLEGLSPAAAHALQAAALLGRELEEVLLVKASRVGGTLLMDAIDELVRRQILEESSLGQLRFVHDKIREVACERIAERERAELHRAIAAAIETQPQAQRQRHLAALGHHWEQAAEPERARRAYLEAARQAGKRYALSEAERLYGAYLRLGAEPSAESITARNELAAEVLEPCGRNEEALAELLAALSDARSLGNRPLEGESLRLLGGIHRLTGRLDEARQLCEQALCIARELGARRFEGSVLGDLAVVHRDTGRMSEARHLYEQALEIHRQTGNRRLEGIVLGNLGLLHQEQGRPDQAQQLYEQARTIAREIGERRFEGNVLGNLAILHWRAGRHEQARLLYEQTRELARRIGDRRSEGSALGNLGGVLHDQGRFAEAQPLFEQALDIHRQVGNRRSEAILLGSLADLHHQRGALDEARLLYEQALALARQIGNRRSEGSVLGNLANVSHEQGRVEQAQSLYAQALSIHRDLGNRWEEAVTSCLLAAFERRVLGQLEGAEKRLLQAESLLRQLEGKPDLAVCLCELGHLALARGRSAADRLREAERLAVELAVLPASTLCKALARLRRAQQAFEAREPEHSFRGEQIEDLPEGLRRWLVERGQLEAERAGCGPGTGCTNVA
jgi:eukaryotic-like serine/threonine-protein kinase